jgi:hypothetical protein
MVMIRREFARNVAWRMAVVLFSTILLGCNQGARSLALDKDLARQSLNKFLQCWADGGEAKSLSVQKPSIIGRDPAWDQGTKLAAYSLVQESSDGTNLHITAELHFKSAVEGQETESRHIRYVVGTSPVITVFRAE